MVLLPQKLIDLHEVKSNSGCIFINGKIEKLLGHSPAEAMDTNFVVNFYNIYKCFMLASVIENKKKFISF